MECPHCGCDAVINDQIGAQEQAICSECGLVVSDQIFEDNAADCFMNAPALGSLPAGSTGSMRGLKRSADKQLDHFVSKAGVEEIRLISSVTRVERSVTDEALILHSQACQNTELTVKNRSLKFKQILGACCFYIVLRRHEHPVTAKEMTSTRKIHINHFILMLRKLKCLLHVDVPNWSIGQLTVHTLKKANFNRDIINRTQELIFICDKCWLISGRRRPETVITSAAYFAWLSFQDGSVKDIGYKAFCVKFSISSGRTPGLLKQMKNILLEMAAHIPWILNFDKKHLRYYIPDILQFRISLMQKAFSSAPKNDGECEVKQELDVMPPCKKRRESELEIRDENEEEINDKDILQKYGDKLNCVDLSPTEFEDEMPMFIKTEREMEVAKYIQKLGSPQKPQS